MELVLALVDPTEESKIGIWPDSSYLTKLIRVNKRNYFKSFTNVETRRIVMLTITSSAADIEKFERQVSAKASLRSADLREYWQTGTDRNHYLDEPAAREANENNHSISTLSEYVIMLNQHRSRKSKNEFTEEEYGAKASTYCQ